MLVRLTMLAIATPILSMLPCAADADTGLVARLSYLDVEAGLSDDLVFAMVQDKDGFVWIGTNGGLDRYDGTRIRNFNSELQAHGISVTSLLSDTKGYLWIGTWGSGLFRYDPVTEGFTRLAHDPGDMRSLQSDYVDSLAELSDGTIAVGSQAGVDLVDAGALRVERLSVDGESGELRVRHLHVDAKDTLWIATRAGLFRRMPGTGIHRYPGTDNGILTGNIYTLADGDDGTLLLGTPDGIWKLTVNGTLSRYRPAGLDPHALEGKRVTALSRTLDRDLLIGTLEQGALLEQRKRGRTRAFTQQPPAPYGVPDNQVASLLQTADGSLWIGTLSRGIARASASALALEHYLAAPDGGLRDSRVNDVEFSGDMLWVATETALLQFDLAGNRFVDLGEIGGWRYPSDLSGIQALVPSDDGDFWLHNDTTLFRMDSSARRIEPVPLHTPDGRPLSGFVTGLSEDPTGFLWVSLYESLLIRLDIKTGKQQTFRITDPDYGTALFLLGVNVRSPHGPIVVTNHGLLRITADGQDDGWLVKADATGRINSVLFEDDGGFWLGTASGARHYSKNATLQESITRNHGLPHDNVWYIARDLEDRLWFVTGRGVAVREAGSKTLHSFRARDGLQADTINAVAFADNGKTVIAGPNGLNVFDYAVVADTVRPASLRLTSIEVFAADGTVTHLPATTAAIALEPDQDHLRVQFSLLDFSDSQRNRYEYRVLGSNEQWTSIESTPRMMLQQIEPGSFVLELRAIGPNGVPAANRVSLAFEVKPHWYEALSAKVAYLVAALCPFALLAWLAVRNARTRTYLDAEIHRRRLLETMYAMTRQMTEATTESGVAQSCLNQLLSLAPFEQGALYFRRGEIANVAGTREARLEQQHWLEALPAVRPRLVANIACTERPLVFRNIEIDPRGSPMGIAAHWLGMSASTRDGAIAIILLGRLGSWNDEERQLLCDVFRQAIHGLDLTALQHSRLARLNMDDIDGLLNRNAFLASARAWINDARERARKVHLLLVHIEPPQDHVSGDIAQRLTIAAVGRRVLAHLHADDVAGRLDTWRLAILLHDVDDLQANEIRVRLMRSLQDMFWISPHVPLCADVQLRELRGEPALFRLLVPAVRDA